MALLQEVPFDQFQIFVGNGESPEVFLPRCLLNAERGVSITPEYNDVVIPFCEDSPPPSVIRKYVTQVSAEISGSGKMSQEDADFFVNWAFTGETKNVRARIGTLEISFGAKIGPFNPTVSRDDIVTGEVTFMSDGEISIQTVAE